MQSTENQNVTCSAQDIAELRRFVKEVASHMGELQLDAALKRKAEPQLATLQAQLADEPDPMIVKQAGRTLRKILEGAVVRLLAGAAQPIVWAWIHVAMQKLF